jgi:hypothetical protein
MRYVFRLSVAAVLAGCMNDVSGPPSPAPPALGAIAAAASPHNSLSVIVSVGITDADSVAVRFRLDDELLAGDSVTPAVIVAGAIATIPVLGLMPDRRYRVSAVAYGPGGTATGNAITISTDTLPTDLPQYAVSGSYPAPGYVVFASGPYGLVIDNTGRVVWYRRFADGPGLNFMAQPNGHYAARPTTPAPDDLEAWLELDPAGNVTRTLGCAHDLQPRFHDLITQSDGSYWLMCDEVRSMDLSSFGGAGNAAIMGTALQHISASGTLLFHWSAFDHFSITDLDSADRMGASINWTHGNSIDLDTDGNLIVSFRNLGELTKINSITGAVMWRMGGRRNEFTFTDSPSPAYARQHGVRVVGAGSLLLLDNVGNPRESRAERYTVNEPARTVRLSHSYGSTPGVVTLIGGSVQSLDGGRTLVTFGTAGRVEEYDAEGQLMWRIDGNPGYVFRAQRIRSLYAPGLGTTR